LGKLIQLKVQILGLGYVPESDETSSHDSEGKYSFAPQDRQGGERTA
jgi:hypothetical protein